MPRDPLQLSAEALFRYQVVAEIRARVLDGTPLAEAIHQVGSLPHVDQRGRARTPSRRTLYRWVSVFEASGLAGLEPVTPPRTEVSTVLGDELVALLEREKTRDPALSVPDLIVLARQQGMVGADERICRTTVWRACRRLGVPTRRHPAAAVDMRRFAYPHRMMMVLCDGKHFRAGAKRRKRVALSFLDDATRYGLGTLVGTTETTILFLTGLYQLLVRYGLMNALYLDHGPGFISADTEAVLARLGRRLIHGRARYPQGHGKIERFHRTFKHQLLRTLDGHPEVDPDCGALSLRLSHWLTERYNHTPHEGLDGATPAERWLADERDLVFPADRAWLEAQCLVTFERTVSQDHVVSIDGVDYEVPTGVAGRITITRHLLSERLTLAHDGQNVELAPLDPVANAFARRGRPRTDDPPPQVLSLDAAGEAFRRGYGSILDPDGGYPDTDDDTGDQT